MKQLSQNLRSGKLSVDEVPSPSAQTGQVLVQAAFSLISAGTERTKVETGRKSLVGKALARPDQVRQVIQSVTEVGLTATYQKVKTRLDARSPLGYSASGIVISVGAGVMEFRPGDPVACGGDTAAHAEIMAVPINLCARVPARVGLDLAAFTTLGAIALQGIRQADVRVGECVGVIGLGLLGQLTVQILKSAGCLVAGFDPNKDRCELSVRLGADTAASVEEALKNDLMALTSSRGGDAVIITAATSSDRPVELAGELCRDKGRVVVVGAVGLTLPREPYYQKELTFSISRSYGPGRYDPDYEEKGIDYPYGYVRWTEKRNMEAFLALLATGKVNALPLITHRFKLDQAEEAYALISKETPDPPLGVLFEYEQSRLPADTRISIKKNREAIVGRLSVGVIGAGHFAQGTLLPYLKKDHRVLLQGVATRSPLGSRDAGERFGFRYAASDSNEVLKDPDIQAVIITTRHESHASLSIQALAANKAVYLEKPLALSMSQVEEIIQAYDLSYSNSRAPFLMVGFNRRFAPMIQEITGFFAGRREALSIMYRVNAGYVPADIWVQDPQQGGGRIIGEACHFIDLIQFLAGAPIHRVYAQALPNRGKYHDDNVSICLELEDGSVGTIVYVANGDKAIGKERLEIFGEGKIAILEDFRKLTLVYRGKTKVSRHRIADQGYSAEVAAWVEAVTSGNVEPVSFADAVSVTKTTFAVHTSLAERRLVSIS